MTLMVLQPLFVQGPVGIEFATIRRQQAWFRVFFSVTRNPGMDVIFICTPSWHQPHRALRPCSWLTSRFFGQDSEVPLLTATRSSPERPARGTCRDKPQANVKH